MGKKKERTVSPTALTAKEIIGGPGMMPPRPLRQYREAALERAVFDFFSGAGQMVRTQVYCGPAGFADVVTEGVIYELKDWLTRRTYYTAVGQLKGYRNYLNHDLDTAVICNGTNLTPRKLQKFETLYGVPVIVWDPPYKEDRFIPRALRRTLHLCT